MRESAPPPRASGEKPARRRGARRRLDRSRGDGHRTCLGCGEDRPAEELLRLVVGPDQAVHVDLRGKGPGRGGHIDARVACFRDAVKKRRIGRALKVEGLHIDADLLLDEARAAIRSRLVHFLALSQKSGRVVSGVESVGRSLERNELAFVLLARDASSLTARRVEGWARPTGVRVLPSLLEAELIGHTLGKPPRAVVGIRAGELARVLFRDLTRAAELGPATAQPPEREMREENEDVS